VHELKQKTLSHFNEGTFRYFERAFPEATMSFKKVLEIHPEDKTARMFLNKAAYYIATGVPDDWTGVDMMLTK